MRTLYLSCGFFFYLLFFLAWYQRSQSGCLPYFYAWCGLSANLECRSEMCCTRLAENTECKSDAKNCHLGTIVQLCRTESSQLRRIDNQILAVFAFLASLLQRRCSLEVNQTLHDVWPSPVLVHKYTFSGAVAPWRNFARCKIHFASKSCVLLYWQRYCMALQ